MAGAIKFKHLDSTLEKINQTKNILIKVGEDYVQHMAEDIEENKEEESIKNELYMCMLEFAKMRRELDDVKKSVEKAKSAYLAEKTAGKDVDIFDLYSANMKDMEAKHSDSDLEKTKAVSLFKKTILNENEDSATQPSQGEGDDDDIQMTQVDGTQYLCPITKAEFVDPVKNTICGHTYSREAIVAHINYKKGKAKCPKAGCHGNVSLDALVEDNIVAFELRQKNKKRK